MKKLITATAIAALSGGAHSSDSYEVKVAELYACLENHIEVTDRLVRKRIFTKQEGDEMRLVVQKAESEMRKSCSDSTNPMGCRVSAIIIGGFFCEVIKAYEKAVDEGMNRQEVETYLASKFQD